MRRCRMHLPIAAFVAALALSLAAAPAVAYPVVPAAGSAERALIDGLKLIRDGEFDAWATQWCSKAQLCFTGKSIDSLKKYNLPTVRKYAGQCIKGAGDALDVARTVVNGDETKIFITCDPGVSPRPFTLVKEPKGWRFKTL